MIDAAPVVFASTHGHQWAHWVFKSMTLVCCNQCGIVRRADDKNKPCKGKVRVSLRAEARELEAEIADLAGWNEPPVATGLEEWTGSPRLHLDSGKHKE